MVGRSSSGKSSGQGARRGRNRPGDWIWGRHAVLETLRGGRWPLVDIWVADSVEGELADELRWRADAQGVTVQQADAESLKAKCHTDQHQGVLARMAEFPFWSWQQLSHDGGECPLWLLLDGVQDPHNLGAILRSAEVFGVSGVVLGGRHAPINGHVARSSAGAVNHVKIASSDNLVQTVMDLKRSGVAVLAAIGEASDPARSCRLDRPVALVIGNEGEGVAEDVLGVCSGRIGIEQAGKTESLNAAAAAAVLLYEADRQRREASEQDEMS